MSWANPLAGLIELGFPARCAACGAFVAEEAVFCIGCGLTVTDLGGGCCSGCALPADPARGGPCPGCARRPAAFQRAAAALLYGESVARAVVRMKHGGHRTLGRRLARLLVPALQRACAAPEAPFDGALPVPLAARKLRRRGFNQALDLLCWARRLALAAGGPGATRPLPPIERATLLRVRDTNELGRSGPAVRLREVAGAFAIARGRRVEGKSFLLVDDVMTTGATLGECARTLRRAGAARVDVLVLARAP